jgi:hypothetical protein
VGVTITRTSTNMIGTPAAPATVAGGATQTSTTPLDLTSPAGVVEACIDLEVQFGASVPSTNVTIRNFYSLDGTNYVQDGGDIALVPVASTNFDLRYDPPPAASKAKVTVINGNTNSINVWAQGQTMAVS